LLLQTLLKHLTSVIDSSVIKFEFLAQKNETADSKRFSDLYISSINDTLTFASVDKFPVDVIAAADVPTYDPDEPNSGYFTLIEYAQDKNLIPNDFRSDVVEYMKNDIINRYEDDGDQNNYYRELAGLPNTDDEDYISIPQELCERYDIDPTSYLHELDSVTIKALSSAGFVDEMIKMHPDKKYLNYLGEKAIPTQKARAANNFSLLYVAGDDVPTQFYDLFTKTYERSREYVCTVLYNRSMAKAYEYYDNFMGLCIMFMTIQRIVTLSFREGISRDLYDWEFIRNLYDAYNIPFIESLPMETHMTLIKNFNNLLRHKSTDKVLFDLCSLLGYSNVELEKYYLVRDQKLDANNNPVIVYDADGNIDYSQTYELYFKTVPLDEKNVTLALQDKSSTKTYEEVTEADPFWWDSGDLKDSILKDDFNYYESKYISLKLMYNMSDILFELTYAMRLILDQKDKIDKYSISLNLPKINMRRTFSLFDIAVFILAGISKMNSLEGRIYNKASEISHIYGFRFNAYESDLVDGLMYQLTGGAEGAITGTDAQPYASGAWAADTVWQERDFAARRQYPDSISDTVGDKSVNTSWNRISTADEFNELFGEIKNFEDKLVTAMWETDDINQYNAYRAIYDIYMTKSSVDTMFTKSDGSIATTYLDYLSDADPELYKVINDTDKDNLYDVMNHAINRIEDELNNIENLNLLIDDGDTAYASLISLINFFKSYTVDIHSFNVWYLFDSKYYNALRLFMKISDVQSEMLTKDFLNQLYGDCVNPSIIYPIHDKISMKENIKFNWEA
jgi:hypothetical protein